jgi:hypothetical protein
MGILKTRKRTKEEIIAVEFEPEKHLLQLMLV